MMRMNDPAWKFLHSSCANSSELPFFRQKEGQEKTHASRSRLWECSHRPDSHTRKHSKHLGKSHTMANRERSSKKCKVPVQMPGPGHQEVHVRHLLDTFEFQAVFSRSVHVRHPLEIFEFLIVFSRSCINDLEFCDFCDARAYLHGFPLLPASLPL